MMHTGLVVIAVTVMVASPACYWLRYEEITATHVGLMERLALDSRDSVVELGAPVDAGSIQRLAYPLARAKRFEEIARRRRPADATLDRLAAVSAAYQTLVEYLEGLGGRVPTQADKSRVDELARAVSAAAAEAREAARRAGG